MERGTALVPPMEDVLFSIGTCLSWKKMSSRLLTVSERGREGGREGETLTECSNINVD